jgi:hypothetical protein
MHGLDYVWKQLRSSVDVLASSELPLRTRLINIWVGGLHLLDSSDFPEPDKRRRWDVMSEQATRLEDPVHGGIHASISAMTDKEAEAMAVEIVSLLDWVCHVEGPDKAL